MDKRVRYYIGLDTETCNSFEVNGKADLSQSIVYDIGWVVTDRRGNIYRKRSFVIYEVFVKMADVMKSAYYAEKIPMYWEQIKNGDRQLVRFQTMYNTFWNDVKEFNIKTAFAHNAMFDRRALNNTIRWITKSDKRFFLPYKLELWCTLKMSRQTIGKQSTYRKWCEANGFMTKHRVPQVRLTAEVLYRYIMNDLTFEESHTGLEDVLIETIIFAKCLSQHKKIVKAV